MNSQKSNTSQVNYKQFEFKCKENGSYNKRYES